MWNNVIISQIEQEHEHFHSEDNMVLCHAKIALGNLCNPTAEFPLVCLILDRFYCIWKSKQEIVLLVYKCCTQNIFYKKQSTFQTWSRT
jgi:hypothetical protein